MTTTTDRPNARPTLLVSVRDSLSLMAFDLETGETVGIAATGEDPEAKPHEFALARDGRTAFVSIYGNRAYGANDKPGKELAIVDLERMEKIGAVDLDLYRAPHGMATDGDGMIWATAEENHCLIMVDPATRRIERSVWMQAPVHFVAAAPDGRRMYAAHKEYPFVTAIDVATKSVSARIGLPLGAQALDVSPDGRRVYVGDFNRPLLHVIDTARDEVARTVALHAVPGWPYATPDGKYVVVTTFDEARGHGFVEILAGESLAPLGVVAVDAEPYHAVAAGDGAHVYVALRDGRIPKIDLAGTRIAEDRLRANGTGAEQVLIVAR